MTSFALAQSYLEKATKRFKILKILHEDQGYSDVMREAQEIVELCLKGILRFAGIEPPKWHDVGPLLLENQAKIKGLETQDASRLADISARLRKEREVSFYGDIQFIPTEEYTQSDSLKAIQEAEFVLSIASLIIH